MIFDYPESRKDRTHGPVGYSSYESFRPWLRDEFMFRCVYCLKRETWGQVTGDFELDHFEPQSLAPHLVLDYFNLVYACRRCNSVKLDQRVDDPLTLLSSDAVFVLPDGAVVGLQPDVQRIIQQLDLNSPRIMTWRVRWMRIIELAREQDTALYRDLTGFPKDLPDLSRLRPPSNVRPDGIAISWYARQKRGQLPESY